MKTGICSGAYFSLNDYREGIPLLKRHGYDAVDFQILSDTNVSLYTSSLAQMEEVLRDVRACADENGVEIVQTHGPWRWPPRDFTEDDRAERFEKMSRSIYATSLLGCRNTVIHPIMPFGWDRDPDPERMWDMNLEYYSRLLPIAVEYNVVICFENMPMRAHRISSPAKTAEFVREMNHPNFRMCLDTGHGCLYEQPAKSVRDIGCELIRVIHVHDNDGQRDAHWPPNHNGGVMDWTDFASALGEQHYRGAFTLETNCGDFPQPLLEEKRIELARLTRSFADIAEKAE